MTYRVNEPYGTKTYPELSAEFRTTYGGACDLIPLMYTRLTEIDKLSHIAAITKIYEDHKDLAGFSRRNIYRALPADNSIVPRRVVPSRHKSSITELNQPLKLSNTKSFYSDEESKGKPTANEISSHQCPGCKILKQKNQELEEALKKSSGPTTADIRLATAGQGKKEFVIPLDIDESLDYIQRLRQSGDLSKIMWLTAYMEIDTGRPISVYLGEPYKNT